MIQVATGYKYVQLKLTTRRKTELNPVYPFDVWLSPGVQTSRTTPSAWLRTVYLSPADSTSLSSSSLGIMTRSTSTATLPCATRKRTPVKWWDTSKNPLKKNLSGNETNAGCVHVCAVLCMQNCPHKRRMYSEDSDHKEHILSVGPIRRRGKYFVTMSPCVKHLLPLDD